MKARPISHRQRGMVLIISLIILLVLTLLGLAAMQNTSLEERMAGNFRSQTVALQAAESSLRAGEGWLGIRTDLPAAANPPASNGVWTIDGPDPNPTNSLMWHKERDATWWGASGVAYANLSQLLFTAANALGETPRHVIEQAGFVNDSLVLGQQQDFNGRWFYQVTARGIAPGGRGEALLRSTYARRF